MVVLALNSPRSGMTYDSHQPIHQYNTSRAPLEVVVNYTFAVPIVCDFGCFVLCCLHRLGYWCLGDLAVSSASKHAVRGWLTWLIMRQYGGRRSSGGKSLVSAGCGSIIVWCMNEANPVRSLTQPCGWRCTSHPS